MKSNLLKRLIPLSVISTIVLVSFSGCAKSEESKENVKATSVTQATSEVYKRDEVVTSISTAKQLLVDGNKRYASGKVLNDDLSNEKRKQLVSKGQHPFTVIVSCSDSRVPPEVIFDQGLGDLFVIRDAGNIVDTVTLGSIEYGSEHAGAVLVVVLGHEKCGAVKATVDGGEAPGNIKDIVEKIKPAYEKVKDSSDKKEDLYEKCTDENIKNTIADIKKSPIIQKLEEEKKVEVIGAKYHIETGEVTFTE